MRKSHYSDVVATELFKHPVNAANIDQDTKSLVNLGRIKLVDDTLRVRKDITGQAGIFDLLLTSDSIVKGVRDFDRAALSPGVYAVIIGISVKYATHATETDPSKLAFSALVNDGTTVVDPALLNARLIVAQDDKVLINKPVSDFMQEQASQDAIGDQMYEFRNKILLLPQKKITVQLDFANAVGTAAKHHVEVNFIVSRTQQK